MPKALTKLKEAIIYTRKYQWQVESAKQQLIAKVGELMASAPGESKEEKLAYAINKN